MNISPSNIIEWAIAITVSLIVLSLTGIQDWIASIVTRRPSNQEINKRLKNIENQLEKLTVKEEEKRSPGSST